MATTAQVIKGKDIKNEIIYEEVNAYDLNDNDRNKTYYCIGCGIKLTLVISSKGREFNTFSARLKDNKHEDGCKYDKSGGYSDKDRENFNFDSFIDGIIKTSNQNKRNISSSSSKDEYDRANKITNLRSFTEICRQYSPDSYIGDMLIRDCFLDGRVFNNYLDGFQGQVVVVPLFHRYSTNEKVMFFYYGNRTLKVNFKNENYFFELRDEIFDIGKREAKIAIAGEWKDEGEFIVTTVSKKRQMVNVTSIINS
ncbi:hypothetical protein [Mammaliicoccus sp. Dog046]|uniref:hypothetical protein n=1 Tax=Mammaliicoccus sp. Dog046 TaxID=3034233 RepID=UPI002B256EF7|nr:hypothetical protein [Mammaliicoccus sp. Dog046]WQK84966.1 hypothetical protein P3U32_10070 [Mammaliicoccus sp. Dog046]